MTSARLSALDASFCGGDADRALHVGWAAVLSAPAEVGCSALLSYGSHRAGAHARAALRQARGIPLACTLRSGSTTELLCRSARLRAPGPLSELADEVMSIRCAATARCGDLDLRGRSRQQIGSWQGHHCMVDASAPSSLAATADPTLSLPCANPTTGSRAEPAPERLLVRGVRDLLGGNSCFALAAARRDLAPAQRARLPRTRCA